MHETQAFCFADWPPSITDDQKQQLTLAATTYALAHGLLYLPPTNGPQPPAPSSAIHAPIALFPSPIPRKLFELVSRLQQIYNVLYARIAMDEVFLDRVMGDEGVSQVDDFTGQLWRGWKQLREEGIAQKLHLGIFRSDYLLHDSQEIKEPMSLKQVEFNTISSSFGALSVRAAAMHRYILSSTGYFGTSPYLKPENMPDNEATKTIVDGLAAAHRVYGAGSNKDVCILFVVQDNERNVFDQRWLEYELLERHSIRVIRQSLTSLQTTATLSPDRTLLVTSPLHSKAGPIEISTIYFRATYTPTDFPTPEHYATRVLLQRSRAINCPTLALQLAGGKKVQQVLAQPGVLERFLLEWDRKEGGGKFSEEDVCLVRETWMEMWGLDEPARGGSEDGVQKALARADRLVLKPQREGGGNNVYHSSIPPFLASLPAEERAAWIAMALIEPPKGVGNYLVRAGDASGTGAHKADVVSELGMFGWALFGDKKVVEERSGGWLLRTKGRESDEGGVAVGFSVLDSVLLVD